MDHPTPGDPGCGPRPGPRVSITSAAGLDVRSIQADDVARVIIQHRRQGGPAPADHRQGGDVRLPALVRPMGRIPERRRRRQHEEGWTRDQVIRLAEAIDA